MSDLGSKLIPGVESPQCFFFQLRSERSSPIYDSSHHIPIYLREFLTIDISSLPTLPPSGSSALLFRPLQKLAETNICLICSIERFLGGPLLLDMDGSVQSKIVCTIVWCSSLLLAPHNNFEEKGLFGEGWDFFLLPLFSFGFGLCTVVRIFWVCGWYIEDFTGRELGFSLWWTRASQPGVASCSFQSNILSKLWLSWLCETAWACP